MQFLNNVDLAKNQLQNAVIHPLSSAPLSPVEGQIYHDTVDHKWYYWNGTTWIDPRARANHTGTQAASSIIDFDTQVRLSRLDQLAAPTSSVAMNSQKITGLASPTVDTDAATKAYADAAAVGIDAKPSCVVATTANITLSGTQTIDGISVTAGMRVLVKDQTAGAENGIWVCSTGAWTRATDMDTSAEYTSQAFTFIEQGTVNSGTQWKVSTSTTIIVGTTVVVWAQWGAGATYTAGNGLGLTGNDFNVGAGTGISVDSANVNIDTAVVVRKYATSIGDGAATSYTITHNLGTRDVTVSIIAVATPYAALQTDWQAATTNTIAIDFSTAPTTNQFRIVIHG